MENARLPPREFAHSGQRIQCDSCCLSLRCVQYTMGGQTSILRIPSSYFHGVVPSPTLVIGLGGCCRFPLNNNNRVIKGGKTGHMSKKLKLTCPNRKILALFLPPMDFGPKTLDGGTLSSIGWWG